MAAESRGRARLKRCSDRSTDKPTNSTYQKAVLASQLLATWASFWQKAQNDQDRAVSVNKPYPANRLFFLIGYVMLRESASYADARPAKYARGAARAA